MKYLVLLISIIILKSCGSAQDVASIAETKDMSTNETLSGTFIIEQLKSINLTKELTLEFDSKTNKISGFAGCNRFFGTYSIQENSISFSELGATMMVCEEEANTIERTMFQTMAKINAYELSEGQLMLKQGDDTLIVANETKMPKARQGEAKINLTYRASTRGFFEMIMIEGRTFKYTNDRNLKEIHRYEMSDEEYSEISALYNELDIKSIPTLEPPSKTHQYDAAPMATLEIIEGEESFKTQGFDHGNAPESITKLIAKLLYIKEIAAKH